MAGAVIESHRSPVVVLIKPLRLVAKGQTILQDEVMHQHFIIAPSYLETVAVGIFAGIGAVFQESVLKSPTIFEGGGDIIGSPEVSVPAVITVAPCAAAVNCSRCRR